MIFKRIKLIVCKSCVPGRNVTVTVTTDLPSILSLRVLSLKPVNQSTSPSRVKVLGHVTSSNSRGAWGSAVGPYACIQQAYRAVYMLAAVRTGPFRTGELA
jgi:hypothetical protein